MRVNKTYILIITFVSYSFVVYILVHILSIPVPGWMEKIISILAMPLWVLVSPFLDVLRKLGLTKGEWIVIPTFLGYILIIFFYTIVLYVSLNILSWIGFYIKKIMSIK